MMRTLRYGALIALLLVLAGISPHAAQAQATPVVTCTSVVGELTDNLSVDILVNDITGLYGVDIIGTFDTRIAQVVDANTTRPGVQIQPLYTFFSPDFVVRDGVDTVAGTYNFASTQVAPSTPVSGSGAVFRVTFHALTYGIFTINFTKHELVNIDGGKLAHTTQSCTVRFRSPLAVELAGAEATRDGRAVVLAWETTSESQNAGFNVYRSPSAEGERTLLGFVPSPAPGATAGQSYTYRIETPAEGDVYWLEDVSLTGQRVLHGPYVAPASEPDAVKLSQLGAFSVCGIPLASAALIVGLGVCGLFVLLKPRVRTRR